MEILSPQSIIDSPQPAAMKSIEAAAHTDAVSKQAPESNDHCNISHASGPDDKIAESAEKQARSSVSPVDSVHSAEEKEPEEQMPPPPKPIGHQKSSISSLINSKSVGEMGVQGVNPHVAHHMRPKLPAPAVISLPIYDERKRPMETQSFPVTKLYGPPSHVTRLIPSVNLEDEHSDHSIVANPYFVPTSGVVHRKFYNAHAEQARRLLAYSASSTCPAAYMYDGNVMTSAPAKATGALHTSETRGHTPGKRKSQKAQHNAPKAAPAEADSQEVATITASDLSGTSTTTISTVEEIATPQDESMPAQPRNKAPPLSQTPEPAADATALARGLYGRERNQKRAATKAYRQPITPRALRPSDSKKAAKRPSSPATANISKPKRAAPAAEGPKQKRPRLSSTAASTRSRRATHPVDLDERKSQELQQASEAKPERSGSSLRPIRNIEADHQYVAQLQEVLKVRGKARKADMGKRQAVRINDLLDLARYPSAEEALFLTKEEATEAVSSGKFFNGPIITEGQQGLPLQTVAEFCDEYYDDETMVWIQDPEIKPSMKAQIARQVKMGTVKERLAGPDSGKPWNCLELATHSDDGLKPSFLNTEDCRLLTKLKIPDLQDKPEARRRAYLPGYKEVEKWALLAQAGALTEPHQDSHGYSTYITMNQGQAGFGWLSFPTDEERAAWRRNPAIFRGGRWRYIILKLGQTVYFPAGTVHFVFRLPSGGNTLAFGGHVLRCSNIVHWVKTLIEERDAKNVTNEDLTESAPGYLARVEKFVKQARLSGQEAKWGGEASIKEFLRLKEEFLKRKQK